MKAVLSGVSKGYGGRQVLQNASCTLEGVNVLTAPSGAGKTTLARLLLGLETPDSGTIQLTGRLAAQFQEDRLCPQLTAVQNVTLVCPPGPGSRQEAEAALQALGLAQQERHKPAAQLSGGQARRVALARAMLAPADGVILDEPFQGLDDEAKQTAIRWVKKTLAGRWLLLITHDAAEAAAFGGGSVPWPLGQQE